MNAKKEFPLPHFDIMIQIIKQIGEVSYKSVKSGFNWLTQLTAFIGYFRYCKRVVLDM